MGGVFEQRPAGVLDELGGGILAHAADRAGTGNLGSMAGGVPLGASDLVQCVVGELDEVEGVGADPGQQGPSAGYASVGAVQSIDAAVSCAVRSAPRAS
jgi:hypothetical protein